MTTTVKHFHSAMTGAPVLSGTAGSLIAVLDACLVDGFNLKTAASVVVASGVATVTISLGVGAFEVDTIALIAGATPSGLNGEKRILSVSSNAFTFDATGISDQTATGTITAKLAPAGWAKTFSGTNLAAYRGSDISGTGMYLRVDDTGTTNARVVGYESMTDVNTGANPWPTAVQQSGGYYWPKADAANSTARAWTVIADGRTFWLHIHCATSNPGYNGGVVGFGDFSPFKSGDAYAAMINGAPGSSYNESTSVQTCFLGSCYQDSVTNSGTAVPRSYTGIGSSILPGRRAESYAYSDASSGNVAFAAYPNGPDNSLIMSRMLVVETGPHVRGVIRGAMFVAQNCATLFSWRDKVTSNGRKYLAIKGVGAMAATVNAAELTFFDITGPW